MDINEFKEKKVWAVVGSVHSREKFAYKIYKDLKNKGYEVYPVDPTGAPVDDEASYRSIKELPIIPEAIDMVINPVKGLQFLEEAKDLGIKHIWFQPGAESEEIIKKAQSYEMKEIHNKCVMVEF
jgi:uncharacterized protein